MIPLPPSPPESSGPPVEFSKIPPESSVAPSPGSDRALVHGIAWTAGAKWATQIVTWGSTIVVARLLTPDDYGLVGMAAVYLGLVAVVSEFGIGSAIVTLHDLSKESIEQLNGLSFILGTCMFALSCAVAKPLAAFFHSPQLVLVVLVLSTSFVVGSFRSIPNSLLQRDLKFREIAAIDSVKAIFGAVAAIILAIYGLHYWALVLSEVGGVFIATLLTVVLRPRRLSIPRFGTIETAITFSRDVLVSRLSWFIYSNSDFLVAGRVLGRASLGAYDFAWTLINLPVEKVTAMISGVAPAIFSSVQHDVSLLKRYVLGLTEGVSLVAFPFSVGAALVAHDLIIGVFGEKWAPAIAPLRLLAGYTTIRSIMPILSPALTVLRRTRFLMYYSITLALIYPGVFYFASRYGIIGIAAAWVVLYPLSALPLWWLTFKLISTAREYFTSLRAATVSSIIMAGFVLAAIYLIPAEVPRLIKLGIEVVTGAVSYSASVLLIFPERVQTFKRTIRGAF
ncbi:MAG: lipopolysaccharide biosynthesis protein [Gemmatimonadaceae bacterium]